MYGRPTEKRLKKIHPKEKEYILRVHYFIVVMNSRKLSIQKCCEYVRSKTNGKFSRWYFYNIMRDKMLFSKFSTLLLILDYCQTDFTTLESIQIPESYRRKYIK
jgi:hypothetical protein